jgi:hypothetical protein
MTQPLQQDPDPNVRVTPEIDDWMQALEPYDRAHLKARLSDLTDPACRRRMHLYVSDTNPQYQRAFIDNNLTVLFKVLAPGELPPGEHVEPDRTILVAGIDPVRPSSGWHGSGWRGTPRGWHSDPMARDRREYT